MSLQLQKIKDKFSDLGKTTQRYGALAGLTAALSFSQVAHSATTEDIRLCEQRWGTCTAEQADLHKNIEANVAADKTRRAVRRHSYRNPQDIGVYVYRGQADRADISDHEIKTILERKISDHFIGLSRSAPNIHIEIDPGYSNKGATGVMYYVDGKQVLYDLNGDGLSPDTESIFKLGDSVSEPVFEAIAEAHKKANPSHVSLPLKRPVASLQ